MKYILTLKDHKVTSWNCSFLSITIVASRNWVASGPIWLFLPRMAGAHRYMQNLGAVPMDSSSQNKIILSYFQCSSFGYILWDFSYFRKLLIVLIGGVGISSLFISQVWGGLWVSSNLSVNKQPKSNFCNYFKAEEWFSRNLLQTYMLLFFF